MAFPTFSLSFQVPPNGVIAEGRLIRREKEKGKSETRKMEGFKKKKEKLEKKKQVSLVTRSSGTFK